MKKIISCVLILAALLALVQPACAAQPPEIDAQYVNAIKTYVTLSISASGKATIVTSATAKTGVTNITAITRIQRKVGNSWIFVENWRYSTTNRTFSKSYSTQLSVKGQYRAVTDFTLTGATTEYITNISTATY